MTISATRPIVPDQETVAPAYFRTYDQIHQAALDLQKQFPDLVHVTNIGDSYKTSVGDAQRPIFAIELHSNKGQVSDPEVVHVAGVHAREISPPEVLMKYAEWATSSYGKDEQATKILDSRKIILVPVVNPDGHAKVELGYETKDVPLTLTRKNSSPFHGTDLNRNFPVGWKNTGEPLSSETYQGDSPGSEVETQAVTQLLAKDKPAMFVDWHSPAGVVLYPWAHTDQPPPDAVLLAKIAGEAAAKMGVPFKQTAAPDPGKNKGYPAGGTSADYAYGQLGIPSISIELPNANWRFKATDEEFADQLKRSIPTLNRLNELAGELSQT